MVLANPANIKYPSSAPSIRFIPHLTLFCKQIIPTLLSAGPPKNQPKCAGAQQQKPKILKNFNSFPHKHLRFSKTAKYPNFRTKRAGCSKGREADFVGWGRSPRHSS